MAFDMKIRQPRPVPLTLEQTCLRFASYAEEYASAAIALDETRFFSVRYYLFGHAFELILKSFILAKGEGEKKIRKLNHSLVKIYREAMRLGYTPSNRGLPIVIDWLDPFHENQDFRYAGHSGVVIMPRADDTLEVFKQTHADILPLAKNFYTTQRPI